MAPGVRLRFGAGGLAALLAASPAFAQTLAEMRDAMEIMVNTSTICADYLQRPEVTEEWQRRALENLTELGMETAEAEAFIAEAVAAARAETLAEVQKQVACEMVNVRALK